MRISRSIQGAMVVSLLVILPQCDLFKKTEKADRAQVADSSGAMADTQSGGEVLLTIDGHPRITVDRFESYMNTVLDAQPQLKQLINLMPEAETELFKSMANEELLQAWIAKNGIDQGAGYKKDLQMIQDFGKRQLAIKYFQEQHPAKISEAEVRKYYDENKKTTPELMTSRGGISAMLLSFEKPDEAENFFALVKDGKNDFVAKAREAKLPAKELKEVTEMSYEVEGPVRDALVAMTKFPATQMIKGKDKTYVVKATAKKEPQYVPFEQIKQRLEGFLQQQKMAELFTAELEKLKNEFKMVENKDYFDRRKKSKEEQMNKMMESQGQMQGSNDPQQPVMANAPAAIQGA